MSNSMEDGGRVHLTILSNIRQERHASVSCFNRHCTNTQRAAHDHHVHSAIHALAVGFKKTW